MANHDAERDRVALIDGEAGNALMTKILQDHVKQQIAAHKHARRIVSRDALPRTWAGKTRRFRRHSN